MLNYPRVAKPLRYEKKANTIFVEVKQLVQQLQSAVTEQRTIWESITLVVAFDLLHDNFEMTTASLLHSSDKNLEEIQQIVTWTKAANLAKRAVGVIVDLALMAKKKQPERTIRSKPGEECFDCGKKGHYAKDCHSSTSSKKKLEKSTAEANRSQWKKNQAKSAISNEQDDCDSEPYPAGQAFMTLEVNEDQSEEWYLDSCASRHIFNNCERFADLRSKSYKFVTAGGTIIRSSQVGTITLPLKNGLHLILSNVAFTPECDSNLIFLGQLRDTIIIQNKWY